MNRFWKGTVVVALMGMCLWGWITWDIIDSIRCLRMGEMGMGRAVRNLYNSMSDLQAACSEDANNLKRLDTSVALLYIKQMALLEDVTQASSDGIRAVARTSALTDRKQSLAIEKLERALRRIDRQGRELDSHAAVSKAMDSVLVVCGESGGHGSGFFIDKAHGIILTAGHVAAHGQGERLWAKQRHMVTEVLDARWDPFSDVGLVFIDPNVALWFLAEDVPISVEDARVGDFLISAGYPMGFVDDAPYASLGTVIATDVQDMNGLGPTMEHQMKFHLEIIPGMSGGPILNTSAKIVSLNSAAVVGTQISGGPSATSIQMAVRRLLRQLPGDQINDASAADPNAGPVEDPDEEVVHEWD